MTRFPVPGPVVVVVVSVLLSALFDFEGHGIAVVGDIPAGLPALTLPRLAGLPLDTILLGAAAIFLVSFGAGIVTARSFGAQAGYAGRPEPRADRLRRRQPRRRAVRRLPGHRLGLAHRGQPDASAAARRLAGIVAAATLVATLLFLGPALAHPADPGARRHPRRDGARA